MPSAAPLLYCAVWADRAKNFEILTSLLQYGDIEDRHVRGRVKHAFRSRTAEAPEPGQCAEQSNLVSRHEPKGAIHLVFWGRDPDGVEFTAARSTP